MKENRAVYDALLSINSKSETIQRMIDSMFYDLKVLEANGVVDEMDMDTIAVQLNKASDCMRDSGVVLADRSTEFLNASEMGEDMELLTPKILRERAAKMRNG